MSEIPCGSLHRRPLTLIAFTAARIVKESGRPILAVTLDPDGNVWVEEPDEAAEVDVLGVYSTDRSRNEIEEAIRDDLRHERKRSLG